MATAYRAARGRQAMTRAELKLAYARQVLDIRKGQWQRLKEAAEDITEVSVEEAWLVWQEAEMNVQLALLDVREEKRS